MTSFVFFYVNAEDVGSDNASFIVHAKDQDEATLMLVKHCHATLGWSDDIDDYYDDIDEGNLVILKPTEVKWAASESGASN